MILCNPSCKYIPCNAKWHCGFFVFRANSNKFGWPLKTKNPATCVAGFVLDVIAAGFEPATVCLEGRCSIQLSYATGCVRSPVRAPQIYNSLPYCPNKKWKAARAASPPKLAIFKQTVYHMQADVNVWYGLPLKTRAGKAPTVDADVSLAEAAGQMEAARTTAVLIERQGALVGIFTLKDLRRALASDPKAGERAVGEWMSYPVRTFPNDLGMAAAQIAMLRYAISHLVLTEDGTPESRVTGMVEQRDILITQSHNPGLLVRKIKKATDLESLLYIVEETDNLIGEYLESGIPLPHLARVKAALTDAVVERVIEQRLEEHPQLRKRRFAWLALGSLGREEQLLRTDQDNALVFADTAVSDVEELQREFLNLAEGVNRDLDHLGFAYCPAEMMAQNPEWCLPLSQWKQKFSHWIKESDEQGIMHSCIFFDARFLYGDAELVRELDAHIEAELRSGSLFIGYMAVNALKAPRTFGLFGRLARETEGEKKGLFDLKARGLMPLADAARTLCLAQGRLHPTGTVERLDWLEGQEPQNAILYRSCKEAYIELMEIRVRSGIRNGDSGRYLDLKSLDPGQRRTLIQALKTIKPLKSLLEVRFRVSGMM